ncbi:MAG: hypothetical protein WC460_05185 [Patescibacteria group bacterium]
MANLKLCKIMKKFKLYAFVILLHHFHLLFLPENPKDLSKIMQFLKRNISRDINFVISHAPEVAIHESLLREGEEMFSQLRGRLLLGKTSIIKNRREFNKNLKQKYKKYEKLLEDHYRFLLELKKQFILKYGENQNVFPKFHWEKSFHDHYIRNSKDFDEHVKYIYNNPVKHKIPDPENYKYVFTKYPELVDEI